MKIITIFLYTGTGDANDSERITKMMKKIIGLVVVALFVVAIAACTSESEMDEQTSGADQLGGALDSGNASEADHGSLADEHADDDHADVSVEAHEVEHTEAADHPHGEAVVDPGAPVIHVYASEFGYAAETLVVRAGEPFTIMLHNTGAIEHDIVIEGFEDDGGIHLIPGEDGKATFTISEHGEYKVYCTVPGHRGAGMEDVLVVED